jgi:hypothetical protein
MSKLSSRARLAKARFTLMAIAAIVAGCATPAPPGTPAAPVAGASAGSPAPAASPAATPGGAAGTAASAKPPARPAASASSPAAAPARPPGAPPPFAEVTKDAKDQAGFLTVWTKDDKTWLEIPAERLNQPFFLGNSLASGLGERFFLPGLMGREQVVVLRRAGNAVQLVARNLQVRAPEGTPLARAVAESYSDSLLASAPLAAAAHPDRKSILVDAQALLAGDLSGLQTALETAFRMPYALDRGNSTIERTRTGDHGAAITFRSHFAVPKLPAPPVLAPGAPPPNPAALPNPPRTVPDGRSLFLSVTYTLAPLPATPMKPRIADQRVGYFTDGFVDYAASDTSADRRRHYINRWRLEKKDPAAAIGEPKEPIRVVLDRNIPERWRTAVRAGVLEWNKAFERAGWRNALAVEQQPADADWESTEGTRLLAVRWFAMEGPGATAVGPSQTDPRTGEILRGAAIIPENWVRLDRTRIADTQPRLAAGAAVLSPDGGPAHEHDPATCDHAFAALEHAQFGFALLEARGAVDPDSPEAERFITDALKAVVIHEVGHALGLRHNFLGSTGISRAQLRDARFIAERGTSNSVMDYNNLNTPLRDEPVTGYSMTTLGAYDYWAIEYGYRELAPEREKQELAAIAGRAAADPNLAYATDEDLANGDPAINQFDLGDDPMAFAQRQFKLARELWDRTQTRQLPADDDLTVYRRNLQRGLASFAAGVPMLSKYVGGIYSSRALAGSAQALVTPVPAAQQRQALDILLGEIFSSESFRFDPRFVSRLGIDHFDRFGPNRQVGPDFSLNQAVLDIQRSALDNLMADAKAARLADAEAKVADPQSLATYADVQDRLSQAIWSELKAIGKSRTIDSLRRGLQREHVRRLAAGLLRPASPVAADVRAVHRQVAQQLEADLRKALASAGWTGIARAHLADSQAVLAEALRAPLTRQGA